MLSNDSDQPTRRIPAGNVRSDMTLANPDLVWHELSNDDKGRFLLVAIRTIGHAPLPETHWTGLITKGLAGMVNGSLTLSPAGVFLLQWVVEHELKWVGDWTLPTSAS